MLARTTRFWLLLMACVSLGCGGASDSDEDGAAGEVAGEQLTGDEALASAEAGAASEALSVEEIKALNEALQCKPGEVVCDDKALVECTSTGSPEVLKTCDGAKVCVEGDCADLPSCTKGNCQYDGAYCPDTYPACPYGVAVGDIVENAMLHDPVTKNTFNIGQHYGEEGVLVLVAANGW